MGGWGCRAHASRPGAMGLLCTARVQRSRGGCGRRGGSKGAPGRLVPGGDVQPCGDEPSLPLRGSHRPGTGIPRLGGSRFLPVAPGVPSGCGVRFAGFGVVFPARQVCHGSVVFRWETWTSALERAGTRTASCSGAQFSSGVSGAEAVVLHWSPPGNHWGDFVLLAARLPFGLNSV